MLAQEGKQKRSLFHSNLERIVGEYFAIAVKKRKDQLMSYLESEWHDLPRDQLLKELWHYTRHLPEVETDSHQSTFERIPR